MKQVFTPEHAHQRSARLAASGRGRRPWPLLMLLLAPLLGHCRTVSDDSSRLEEEMAARQWYDMRGQAGACEPAPPQCAKVEFDKVFVDKCAAAEAQARSCGCTVKCSRPVPGYQAPAADPSQGGAGGAETAGPEQSSCQGENLRFVTSTLGGMRPGSALSRCADVHVCRGRATGCDMESLAVTSRLRLAGRTGCENQVLGVLCRDGFDDTLRCPESDIAQLSALQEGMAADPELRKCVRNLECGGSAAACSDPYRRKVEAARKSLNRPGCEYWLRLICTLGGL